LTEYNEPFYAALDKHFLDELKKKLCLNGGNIAEFNQEAKTIGYINGYVRFLMGLRYKRFII
jgi:hypothetical protein